MEYKNRNGFKKSGFKDSYVGAPYNFVPFYNDVVGVDEADMSVHDVISDELLTGEISYRFKAETPIIIGDGCKDSNGTSKEHFFRNERGQLAIPGSTIRGLIRNNVQILGLSGFDQDIEDYHLMFREVASGIDKKRYGTILGNKAVPLSDGKQFSILENVRAGYIVKEGETYRIYKTVVDKINTSLGEMNYYVLSERKISEDTGCKNFPYFKKHPEKAQHQLDEGFELIEKNGTVHYKGEKNNDYKPGYEKVSYTIKDLKKVIQVGEPGVYSSEGTLMRTGKMNEKKVQYIIPEIDKSKEYIKIPKEDIRAFEIDFNKRLNALKGFGDPQFFNLPKEGEEKPVFYIELPQSVHGMSESSTRLYFGFTPRLRLFYDHTIKDGYHQSLQDFDYAMSLFGMTRKSQNGFNVSYKSKTSFSDAVVCGDSKEMHEQQIILAEPKATSYQDYLKQADGSTTYNSDEFELRGVKQYWLRNETIPSERAGKSEKIYTHLCPLDKGACFDGKVRFENLTRAELGLLLWSIKLQRNSWMNIGKAKAYGYGAISVEDVQVSCRNNAKAYALSNALNLSPFEMMDVDKLIQDYKDEVNAKIPNGNIDKLRHIKTFFAMKDSKRLPEKEKIRYMSIDRSEYQSRKKALPEVNDILKDVKRPMQEGVHMAEVIKCEGKKIKFKVKDMDVYPKISIDEIQPQMPDLTRKTMAVKFPQNAEVKLKLDGEKWSIVL